MDSITESRILLAAAVYPEAGNGLETLPALYSEVEDEEARAEIMLWIYRLGGGVKSRDEALWAYRKLYRRIPKITYRYALEELGAGLNDGVPAQPSVKADKNGMG